MVRQYASSHRVTGSNAGLNVFQGMSFPLFPVSVPQNNFTLLCGFGCVRFEISDGALEAEAFGFHHGCL